MKLISKDNNLRGGDTNVRLIVISYLITITIISLTLQNVNGSTAYEELYYRCLIISPRTLCDYLFGHEPVSNTSNSSSLSNYSALTYNDKELGFSIVYPLGWKTGQGASEFNTVVRFIPPQNDANVDVRIFPKGDYNSIDEYGQTFKQAHNEFKLLNYYRNSTTTLSDKPALRAFYLTSYNANINGKTNANNSVTLKEMIVATMVPEKDSIYAIAYFTKPANFDNYLPVAQKMVDSFQIFGK